MGTVTLAATKNAWARSDTPTVNYSSGNFATFQDADYDRFFLSFDAYPADISLKPIQVMMINQYAVLPRNTSGDIVPIALKYGPVDEEWTENLVTYVNQPSVSYDEQSGYHNQSINYWFSFGLQGTFIEKVRKILSHGVGMYPITLDSAYYADEVQLATRFNSTASLRPYVTITYDDANAFLTPTLREKSGYVNPANTAYFSYTVAKSSFKTLGDLSVDDVTIYWMQPGNTGWHGRSGVAGPVEGSILVPPNTFPRGVEELQVKICVKDNGGTETDSNTITISTKDALLTTTPSSPINFAIVDETKMSAFTWKNTSPNNTSATGADLEWSTDGETWQSLGTVTGSATYFFVPANTFPVSVLYWRVRSYNSDGVVGDWSTAARFTTVDTQATATPLAPQNVIRDGDAPIVFTWLVSNQSGSEPSGSDLQYSTDGTNWSDLTSVTGAANTVTMPAGTFLAGMVYWRVRAYNRQNVAGSWSSALSFIVVAAPQAPNVYADGLPFTTIEWQAAGQQAYRLTVDGKTIGPTFGTEKQYTLTQPLADGEHSVGVAVQNAFGLWSETTEFTFSVLNQPGDPVELSGDFAVDAELSWTTDSTAAEFLIYRDDVQIGSSSSLLFTDRFVLGSHSYYVLNVLPGGYYTKSNVVTGTMSTEITVIDTLQDPSGWMPLRLTANDPDEQVFSYQRTASLRHITAAELPVLELSKYVDSSGTYDVAFPDLQSAKAFEAFKGKVVIIKSRGENVVIGALLQLQQRVGDFFSAYTFTVQQIAWEDFVDDQDS